MWSYCNAWFTLPALRSVVLYLYVLRWLYSQFLGAVAKLRKASISLVISVRPHDLLGPHWTIFMKFDI
jgi:hypothetical protein